PMEVHRPRQGGIIPATGIEMHIVPVGNQSAREIRNVSLAAAAGRQDVFITECDVHIGCSSRTPNSSCPRNACQNGSGLCIFEQSIGQGSVAKCVQVFIHSGVTTSE